MPWNFCLDTITGGFAISMNTPQTPLSHGHGLGCLLSVFLEQTLSPFGTCQTSRCTKKLWMLDKETCLFDETVQFIRNYKPCSAASQCCCCCCCRSSGVFHAIDSATLQAAHRCTHAPYVAVLPTHSFGDVDHLVIQIFALHVRCGLVLQRQSHCSTVCKVATAPLLQTCLLYTSDAADE